MSNYTNKYWVGNVQSQIKKVITVESLRNLLTLYLKYIVYCDEDILLTTSEIYKTGLLLTCSSWYLNVWYFIVFKFGIIEQFKSKGFYNQKEYVYIIDIDGYL